MDDDRVRNREDNYMLLPMVAQDHFQRTSLFICLFVTLIFNIITGDLNMGPVVIYIKTIKKSHRNFNKVKGLKTKYFRRFEPKSDRVSKSQGFYESHRTIIKFTGLQNIWACKPCKFQVFM